MPIDPSQNLDASKAVTPVAASLKQKALSEFIGTFALVFAGCGAIVVNTLHGGAIGHVGISMVFGLVVTVMIYATGHIGGAHFNPAVTIAFAAVGRFSWRQVPAYLVAQTAAATLAAWLLSVVFGLSSHVGATLPTGGVGAAFTVEVVLTFILMFVIIAVATDFRAEGAFAGLAIGSAVTLGALMGGPVSGASMNPARSLGPALISGQFADLWLYLLCPVLGAVAAAFVYRTLRSPAAG